MTQSQRNWIFASIAIAVALLYLLGGILAPFVIAALLAYLSDPLVNRLTRLKIPRTLAVVIVFLVIMLWIVILLLVLVPILSRQIETLINRIPDAINWVQSYGLPWLNQHFGISENLDLNSLKDTLKQNWQQAGQAANTVWKTLAHSGLALVDWAIKLVLIPIVTFYLLRDWDTVVDETRKLLPRRIEPKVLALWQECNNVLGAFIRGQLLVMLSLCIIFSVGLWIAGLDMALLIGVVAGLFAIVPYLGTAIGIVSACIAAYLQFHDWQHLVYVGIIFAVGHLAEGMVLTPLLVGDRIGLHPVAVIFAILVGGHLFGFVGVLVALPVAAVTMVLLRHVKQHYMQSHLYK
jgi:predicted PurR-regulated permease PerM